MMKKQINYFVFLVVFLVLLSSFVSAGYSKSYLKSYKFDDATLIGGFMQNSLRFDPEMCKGEDGSDFILQIAPFGCEPAVVRSDLLEENDVPVFCKISATKINPLIDVDAIKTMTITGKHNGGVKGFAYHPSQSALGLIPDGSLENPIMEDLGYVVIYLKQNPNESSMPEYVEGNLTAKIRYDAKNVFGVGRAEYYLPVMTDEEWEDSYIAYSFWNGRGYLRAEYVGENQADVSIYTGGERATLGGDYVRNRYSRNNLQVGETSPKIYLPGFDPCMASLSLKLNGIEDPDTRARLKINNEIIEVVQNAEFLENKCEIMKIERKGVYQEVKISCRDDETGTNRFTLSVSPKISLNIEGEVGEYEIGQRLYGEKRNVEHKEDKSVYLGYVGSKSDSVEEENLFAILVSMPYHDEKMLTSDLDAVSTYAKYRALETSTGSNFLDGLAKGFGEASSFLMEVGRGSITGESFDFISYGDGESFKGVDVQLVGFIDDSYYENSYLDSDSEQNYDSAMEDFGVVESVYGDERENENSIETFGEQSLYQAIMLAQRVGKRSHLVELCGDFQSNYPNSNKNYEVSRICDNEYFGSSSGKLSEEVLINGELKIISFEDIVEPGFDDFGAEVLVTGPSGRSEVYRLTKGNSVIIGGLRDGEDFDSSEEYIVLEDLDNEKAEVRIQYREETRYGHAIDYNNEKLYLSQEKRVGGYGFVLREIHLQQVARVSVVPSFNNELSNSTFPFKIGIEKRAIQLTPEKINEKIERIDKRVNRLEGTVNFLGGVVKVGNSACIGTGLVLTAKNLISGWNGASMARAKVMNGAGGWNEFCQKEVAKENSQYTSIDDCFYENADEIDEQVANYTSIIEEQDSVANKIEGKYPLNPENKNPFTQGGVDMQKYAEEYIPLAKKDLTETLDKTGNVQEGVLYMDVLEGEDGESDKLVGEGINLNEVDTVLDKSAFSKGVFSISELKEIEFYKKVLEKDPSDELAQRELYSLLTDLNVNSGIYQDVSDFSRLTKTDMDDLDYLDTREKVKKAAYRGKTLGEVRASGIKGAWNFGNLPDSTPVSVNPTDKGNYLFILSTSNDKQFTVDAAYLVDSEGNAIGDVEATNTFQKNFVFERFDASDYMNKYVNPEVKYFDEGPNQGYPAVVPIDTDNGWYAATKSVLGTSSSNVAYDTSGRVVSFWLCNVGPNGLENYISGDDVCQMINLDVAQTYSNFNGLDERTTKNLVDRAVNSIYRAQQAYKKGISSVRIDNKRYKVGLPATNIPTIQCQDFMSPKDCHILFNVCDPFICPSSRCDLGGAHPVRDVIQSGIVGSIALCLPNAKEGIYVPVCISGVYAGLDGWVQVQKAYRDCLQENLETGETVGICDEMHSIYMCDFFWRQALPVVNEGLPFLINLVLGKNVARGGGEYLTVREAWTNAQGSVDYFKQYYAKNTYDAFKMRSVDEVGSEVCKSFPSLLFPKGSNLVDSLTQPYSPVQFHGKFSEIPMTTATNPPISHYKVSYFIYAGRDVGAYYRVYLRGDRTGSYYQDTLFTRYVASGYISAGESISESVDEQWPSGYRELCISVNGQEECDFKEVSTSFAVDYIQDKYLQQQASQTDIKTEEECISGSSSLYTLINPNLQSGTEETINPDLYNRGIVRVCATNNPGVGTDPYAQSETPRWVQVGYCGDKNIGCWQDQNSVEDVIENLDIEQQTLDATTQEFLDKMRQEGDYWSPEKVNSIFNKIDETGLSAENKIGNLTELLNHLFWNVDKARAYLERGKLYASLVEALESEEEEQEQEEPSEEIIFSLGVSEEYEFVYEGVTYSIYLSEIDYQYDSATIYIDEPTNDWDTIENEDDSKIFELYGNNRAIITVLEIGDEVEFRLNIFEEQEEPQEEVIDYSIRCSDCGTSFNRCSPEECAAIAEESGRNCVYTVDVNDVWGIIVTTNAECYEEGGEVWPPGFDPEGFNDAELEKIISATECNDCGGILCSEEECEAIGIFLDRECVYDGSNLFRRCSEEEPPEPVSEVDEVRQRIFEIAQGKIGSDTTRYQDGDEVYDNVCSTFVSTVLIEAGLLPEFGDTCELTETTYIASIRHGLEPKLKESKNFYEVSSSFWRTGLIPGDLIIWGCDGLSYCSPKADADEYQHITIFKQYTSSGINVIHDPGLNGKINDERTYSDPFGDSWYITHVWRYTG